MKGQVQKKIALTIKDIDEKINIIRGAVTMAYPEGLPEWDLVKIALDEPIDNLKVTDDSNHYALFFHHIQ